jgi:hypothetical protein
MTVLQGSVAGLLAAGGMPGENPTINSIRGF